MFWTEEEQGEEQPAGKARVQYYSLGHEEQEQERLIVTKRGSSESGYCTEVERRRQLSATDSGCY